MKSAIITIFPNPGERHVQFRPALNAPPASSPEACGDTALQPTSIESVILQKLLAEVEARQIARVQPTYVIEQPPTARHLILIRSLWSLLWLLSIVASVFLVKYIDGLTMVPRADDRQSRSIETLTTTISDQKKDFSTIIDSLQELADVIASSTKRTATIPAVLDRLRNDLQQIRPPLVREPVDISAEAPMLTVAPVPLQSGMAPISMGGHHHPPIEFSVAPPDVVVHHNSLGEMDYWLMPRLISGVRTMVKVVPVAQDNNGTLVHHIAEGKDYRVTSSAAWLPAAESNDKN